MNSVIKLILWAFSNWDQTNWTFLLLIIQLAIKTYYLCNRNFIIFLLYSYKLDTIQMKLSQIKKSFNGKFSKFWANAVINKMRDIIKFAQTVMINVQQKQKHLTNCHYQKSPQLHINDKVWLAIKKQYSTEKSN